MESGIEVEYGNFRIHRYEEDRDGIRLDEYLIPVFHWEDIEKEAEDIIFRIAPEALHDPEQLRPDMLVGRLGGGSRSFPGRVPPFFWSRPALCHNPPPSGTWLSACSSRGGKGRAPAPGSAGASG